LIRIGSTPLHLHGAAHREAYGAQLLARIEAVLAACRAWGAQIVVFPEYSIPWELLDAVAGAAGDLVVVAGTHTVDRSARKSGVYERLGAPAIPQTGQAVCPVLHRGRLLALVAKLNPAVPERSSLRPGEAWEPVAMPEGIPGPMGVLICLDFLFRESDRHRALVAPKLGECRFLAVPSLTPHYTLPEFAGKAWEEARRYGRPVLYCDGASGGGTSLYVDEGAPQDLRRFPDRAGYLEPGDEGVIVADVNLGHERVGRSTRFDAPMPVIPVAEASFVYRSNPVADAYARWLEEIAPFLAREDDGAIDAIAASAAQARDRLLDAGALTGAAARGRRLRRLVTEIDKVTSVDELRRFTREVVLPAEVLPFRDLRAAMAAGSADAIFDWLGQREARSAGFGEVEERLRKAGEAAVRDLGGRAAFAEVAQAVRGPREVEEKKKAEEPPAPAKVVLPRGIDPAALGTREHGDLVLVYRSEPGAVIDYASSAERGGVSTHSEARGRLVSSYRIAYASVQAGEEILLLAGAERARAVAAVGAFSRTELAAGSLFVLSSDERGWTLWFTERLILLPLSEAALIEAFAGDGLPGLTVRMPDREDREARIAALLPRFDGARQQVSALRKQRLSEVDDQFVEPDASVDGSDRRPILGALDAWLESNQQTALVLGEFGTGKSTALAEWAHRRWDRGEPRILLANLAGVASTRDAEALLLDAAGVEDLPAHRAALKLLIRTGRVVPCFDGFDEMATRLDASELAGRLSELLGVARRGGKVIVSSRDNYFPSQGHLETTAQSALAWALGSSAGVQRIVLQPLTDAQVEALVRMIRKGEANEALGRIASIYDLRDLVHRPLLLGMVLATLDDLQTGEKVGRADLYEAYLNRWLDQTRRPKDPECFTDEQKKTFAEALAEQLWRSGEPTCAYQELQQSVRVRLVEHLPETMPLGAAFLEIQGGAFFVREGEDRYRFAHKSFLEYFLARALVATLEERAFEALDTKAMTQEIAGFVGEILRRRGGSAIGALQGVIGKARNPPEATAAAAANALRLLLGLSRWAEDGKPWIPEGADLRCVRLVGEDLSRVRLIRADLERADLSNVDLSYADMTGARLANAKLAGAKLDRALLVGVSARRADLMQAEADEADLVGADLREASLRQSTWTMRRWQNVRIEGADITAGIGIPSKHHPSALPRRSLVTLAAGQAGSVAAIAWSPDGDHLASAGSDWKVRIWGMVAAKQLALLEGHTSVVTAVAWHPNGSRLASAGDDRAVRIGAVQN
jgi:predicted amidohydrolase